VGDRRDHSWSDLFYALTVIGLVVLWWRFVGRLAYRFGVDYYGLSSGRRAAWQALWLVLLYAALMLLVLAAGGHPFG
jgi:hypothetical protein